MRRFPPVALAASTWYEARRYGTEASPSDRRALHQVEALVSRVVGSSACAVSSTSTRSSLSPAAPHWVLGDVLAAAESKALAAGHRVSGSAGTRPGYRHLVGGYPTAPQPLPRAVPPSEAIAECPRTDSKAQAVIMPSPSKDVATSDRTPSKRAREPYEVERAGPALAGIVPELGVSCNAAVSCRLAVRCARNSAQSNRGRIRRRLKPVAGAVGFGRLGRRSSGRSRQGRQLDPPSSRKRTHYLLSRPSACSSTSLLWGTCFADHRRGGARSPPPALWALAKA